MMFHDPEPLRCGCGRFHPEATPLRFSPVFQAARTARFAKKGFPIVPRGDVPAAHLEAPRELPTATKSTPCPCCPQKRPYSGRRRPSAASRLIRSMHGFEATGGGAGGARCSRHGPHCGPICWGASKSHCLRPPRGSKASCICSARRASRHDWPPVFTSLSGP